MSGLNQDVLFTWVTFYNILKGESGCGGPAFNPITQKAETGLCEFKSSLVWVESFKPSLFRRL